MEKTLRVMIRKEYADAYELYDGAIIYKSCVVVEDDVVSAGLDRVADKVSKMSPEEYKQLYEKAGGSSSPQFTFGQEVIAEVSEETSEPGEMVYLGERDGKIYCCAETKSGDLDNEVICRAETVRPIPAKPTTRERIREVLDRVNKDGFYVEGEINRIIAILEEGKE